jgi:hypothetical protein
MSLAHFDSLFTFAAAGLGLFLAGGLNLLFGRGRRVWPRAVVTLVLCGIVLGCLRAATRLELVARAAPVLLGVVLVAGALGSEWFTRQLTALLTLFRKPALRWGLVALGGLMLIIGSGIAFDRAEDALTEQTMLNLELTLGHPATQTLGGALATTDRGTQIALKEPLKPHDPSELVGPEEKTLRDLKYGDQVIRRSGPHDTTNCHGWVFTGGRYLLSPEDVEVILKDNGYQEIHDPQPGDLVVYRQSGIIAHTALVRYVTEGLPVMVEGKWGTMGVFIHAADKSCYGNEYTFYRSARQGHVLVGLGGSAAPNPNAGANTATE